MMKHICILLGCAALLASAGCKKDNNTPTSVKVVTKVDNLTNPWGMVFLPNEDLIFTERTGKISLLKNGETTTSLLMTRTVVVTEGGLLGIAIDPSFSSNHYVYIYETVTDEN